MDNKYKLIVTYEKDEKGEIIGFERLFLLDLEKKEFVVKGVKYDEARHGEDMLKFFAKNGITGNDNADVVFNAINAGIFEIIDDEQFDNKYGKYFVIRNTDEIKFDGDDDDKEDDKTYATEGNYIGSKVASIALGGAGVISILGATGLAKGNNNGNTNNLQQGAIANAQTLINSLNANGQAFFNSVLGSLAQINGQMTKANNFKLDADKTELKFSVEEIIAAKIALNNYSAEDMYNIFGSTTKIGNLSLDAESIDKMMDSVFLKLSTYAMNAKEPSYISSLIEDEDARAFFESHENVVLAFNANPSIENSDAVIKKLYYDYTLEGMNGSYDQIDNDNVARLATAFQFGNMLATRNRPEFNEIHSVSEEEKAKYGNMTVEVGTQRATLVKGNAVLSETLQDPFTLSGELNKKSLCASSLSELEARFDVFNAYKQAKLSIPGELEKGQELSEKLNKIADLLKEGYELEVTHDEVVALINNRFIEPIKVSEKEDNNVVYDDGKGNQTTVGDLVAGKDEETGDTVLEKEEFDKLPPEVQDEVIKDFGEVVDKKEETVVEQVDKEDLTQKEQQQAEMMRRLQAEIDNLSAELQSSGIYDANEYVESIKYKYAGMIVNPYNKEVIDTNSLSLFNIVAHVSAFGTNAEAINSSDKQIVDYLNSKYDEKEAIVNNYIAGNTAEENDYIDSLDGKKGNLSEQLNDKLVIGDYGGKFNGELDRELDMAREMGKQLKSNAEKVYNEAMKNLPKEEVIHEGGNSNTPAEPTQPPETEQPANPTVDHQTEGNPNGEKPWVPPENSTNPGANDSEEEKEQTQEEKFDPQLAGNPNGETVLPGLPGANSGANNNEERNSIEDVTIVANNNDQIWIPESEEIDWGSVYDEVNGGRQKIK